MKKDIIVVDWNSLALTVGMGIWNYQHELNPTTISASIINRLISIKREFDFDKPMIIIGMDSAPYWRQTELFEHYKQNRKLHKDKSDFPFSQFFAISNSMLEIMNIGTDMTVINESGVEADDIVAITSKVIDKNKRLLILSSDHDMTQVVKMYPHKNIKQYSFRRKGVISADEYRKAEHILKGDAGDGIPAYNQPADIFVNPPEIKVRRKLITAGMMDYYDRYGHDQFKQAYAISDDERNAIDRNRFLVDFTYIPEHVEERIAKSILNNGSGIKTQSFEKMFNNPPVPVFLN